MKFRGCFLHHFFAFLSLSVLLHLFQASLTWTGQLPLKNIMELFGKRQHAYAPIGSSEDSAQQLPLHFAGNKKDHEPSRILRLAKGFGLLACGLLFLSLWLQSPPPETLPFTAGMDTEGKFCCLSVCLSVLTKHVFFL
jgi:hypothetical protein